MKFGERLRKCREDLGVSREALAAQLKTSPQTLLKYENSITEPDVHTLQLLAKSLNCSVAFLFGESPMGNEINARAILEAVGILRERGEITLEQVVRAGLTPEKDLNARRHR